MTARNVALVLALGCYLGACTAALESPPGAGPGEGPGSGGDGKGDVSNQDPTDAPGGPERSFVATRIAIPSDPGVGFDLDDHVTDGASDATGCGHADGPGGVDNRLARLIEAVVEAASIPVPPNEQMADNIAQGRLLLVTRLLDVDDLVDDGSVPLAFYVGHDPDGDPTNNLRGDGTVLVHPLSLEDPTDLESARIRFDGGVIDGGVWRAPPSVFETAVPLGDGLPLELRLEDARITFSIDEGGLHRGVVGGVLPVRTILATITRPELQQLGIPTDMVRLILGGQADLDIVPPGPTGQSCATASDCEPGQDCASGMCDEPEGRCDALSVALELEAVPVTIGGIAPPGTPVD